MVQLFVTWLLEGNNLTTLWIDASHHGAYGAVFPCCVHPLQYKQYSTAVFSIKAVGQVSTGSCEFFDLTSRCFFRCLTGNITGGQSRGDESWCPLIQ